MKVDKVKLTDSYPRLVLCAIACCLMGITAKEAEEKWQLISRLEKAKEEVRIKE